jgi:anti-anti-sigma factor
MFVVVAASDRNATLASSVMRCSEESIASCSAMSESKKLSFGRRVRETMDITISDFGSTAKKVTLIGRLDLDGAEQMGPRLASLAHSKTNVVVDMVGVDFIASIGLRHLVMASKAAARTASKLVLLDPNPMVTEVLSVSGLQQVLPIVRSENEALAVFNVARV